MFKFGINWLFIFIPTGICLEWIEASAPLVFFGSALSIVPIANMIGRATENLATYTGDALGGLMTATFGNAPELIIAIIALNAGLHDMVLAALVGAILANLLLATGLSFLIGGLRFHNQDYNPSGIKMYRSMLLIAVISLTIPSAFHQLGDAYNDDENLLNIGLSIALLVAYALYLVFMLKTHPDFFKSSKDEEIKNENPWSLKKSVFLLLASSGMAAVMSEILVGAAESTGETLGMSTVFIGVIFLATISGAAETISAISMARKNKMDLSIGIAIGSSIQVALFLAPVLVFVSLFVGPEQLNLAFDRALIVALFLAVLLASFVTSEGRSNWYKGVQLVMVYLMIGFMFYLKP